MNIIISHFNFFVLLSGGALLFASCQENTELKDPALVTRNASVFLNAATLSADLLNSSSDNFEYGFAYTSVHNILEPSLGQEGVEQISKIATSPLKAFTLSVRDLNWNKTYQYRPYISFSGKTVYGKAKGLNISVKPSVGLDFPKIRQFSRGILL